MPKGETSLVMRARHDPKEIITTQGKSYVSVHPRSSKTLYALYLKLAPVLRHSGEDGNTVLMVVARHPKQPLFAIQLLLEKGAERSSANYQDCTALLRAAKLNHNLVVNSLLRSRKSYYVEKIEEDAERNGNGDAERSCRDSQDAPRVFPGEHDFESSVSGFHSPASGGGEQPSTHCGPEGRMRSGFCPSNIRLSEANQFMIAEL
ncbi:uncharacterized protein RCO7_15125 [Rhynchosporium graminicola]|uniref:Uncharacterized protein n=1 Tax=Rhynchosporium graminicola TaxID=2792576 RepID=A0A1E1LL49_9HELO|nr:uncharacterized protein RCO7_15125 [Rhynchosporium commune]